MAVDVLSLQLVQRLDEMFHGLTAIQILIFHHNMNG